MVASVICWSSSRRKPSVERYRENRAPAKICRSVTLSGGHAPAPKTNLLRTSEPSKVPRRCSDASEKPGPALPEGYPGGRFALLYFRADSPFSRLQNSQMPITIDYRQGSGSRMFSNHGNLRHTLIELATGCPGTSPTQTNNGSCFAEAQKQVPARGWQKSQREPRPPDRYRGWPHWHYRRQNTMQRRLPTQDQ